MTKIVLERPVGLIDDEFTGFFLQDANTLVINTPLIQALKRSGIHDIWLFSEMGGTRKIKRIQSLRIQSLRIQSLRAAFESEGLFVHGVLTPLDLVWNEVNPMNGAKSIQLNTFQYHQQQLGKAFSDVQYYLDASQSEQVITRASKTIDDIERNGRFHTNIKYWVFKLFIKRKPEWVSSVVVVDDDWEVVDALQHFPAQTDITISVIHEYLTKKAYFRQKLNTPSGWVALGGINATKGAHYYNNILKSHLMSDFRTKIPLAHLYRIVASLNYSFLCFFQNATKVNVYERLLEYVKEKTERQKTTDLPQIQLSEVIKTWEKELIEGDFKQLFGVVVRRSTMLKRKHKLTRSEQLFEKLIESIFPRAAGNKRTTIMHHFINHLAEVKDESIRNQLKTLLFSLHELPLDTPLETYREKIISAKSNFSEVSSSYQFLAALETDLQPPKENKRIMELV